ncbi:hypothetical protein N825_06855 [Skermanella stibiiresistens SB22]|uniref:DUF6306 domain-containing protein n=1 Tax=Skermanella stibiiresistens SB22 TaxID=1385369 RepID=W9H088_9PROT|nr:DUF6306 domain-containing protein [Skermanella stibiiresistens]EWY39494.1 hypothetical protein N825_06855 [Skermanella stibiiresistens SB22]
MSELETASCASPPCLAAEIDPAYSKAPIADPIADDELARRLNVMLEVGRASAKALTALVAEFEPPEATDLLMSVQRNQARFCGVLTRVVTQLGETPSHATSGLHDEVLGLDALGERLALLNGGMAWVVGQFDDTLPRVASDELCGVLADLRETHRVDLKDCETLLDWFSQRG